MRRLTTFGNLDMNAGTTMGGAQCEMSLLQKAAGGLPGPIGAGRDQGVPAAGEERRSPATARVSTSAWR
jgi:hypothetical protein